MVVQTTSRVENFPRGPNERDLVHNVICDIAYRKWQARGRLLDDGVDDWLDAEREFEQIYSVISNIVARRLRIEHEVTRILGECREIDDAAPKIVQTICENLDWDVGAIWTLDRSVGCLRCVDVWHTPSIEIPAFLHLCRECALQKGVGLPGRVWANGVPAWIADVTRDDNFPRGRIAGECGLYGAFGFPIYDGTEFLGVIEFFSREIQPPDEGMLETIGSIASQISQFIERRRAEHAIRDRSYEFVVAQRIQKSLLPRNMPTLPGYAVGGACEFAQETGGDYFDFFPLSDSGLGVVIGDASGHGVAAALVMGEIRAFLRAFALMHRDPGTILNLTNRCFTEHFLTDHFVTLFFARFDSEARSLTYCSAGHCSGYVLNDQGEVRSVLKSTSLPLGIDGNIELGITTSVTLSPGDLVFLFTDGIIEARSPADEPFRVQRALEVVRGLHQETPDRIAQGLIREVADFCKGQPQNDDRTAVIVRVKPAA